MYIPLHKNCRVLGTHEVGLVAVDKPAGVLSHPNRRGEESRSVLGARYNAEGEVYEAGGRRWYLLNRLDAPTSGVLLLAETAELAAVAREAFARHAVKKEYVALVRGVVRWRRQLWRDHLTVGRSRGQLRTRCGRGAVNAETEAFLVRRGEGPPARALLGLRPQTGRTHQLRVQCATRQLPIIGDGTYGDFGFNREWKRRHGTGRLLLHSQRTEMEVTFAGQRVPFVAESPLPKEFSLCGPGRG